MATKSKPLHPEAKAALDKILIIQQQRTRLDVLEYQCIYDAVQWGANWKDVAAACGLNSPRGAEGHFRRLSWAAEESGLVAED